jgi:ferredoxin-NADP reductase
VPIFTAPITEVIVATPRNRIVRVQCPDGLPPFDAGQYVSLGDHGHATRKPYSIASSPAEASRTRELEFLIQVVVGESPGGHLARLAAGRLVDIEGPAGTFVLPAGLHPPAVVLIGGGTGIAPLRAMLHHLLEVSPGVRVAVLQSARTPDELCYAAEFRGLAAAGRIALTETVTRGAPPTWRGKCGRVDAAALEELIEGPDTWCFVCGPDSLVEGVPRLLARVGVPGDRIRTEQWADEVLAE